MAHQVQLPFDVLEMIVQQVDDFDTFRNLQYTSTTLAGLAEEGFWENLHLTSYESVIGAFWAIIRKPRIRNMVRLMRLPDVDDGRGGSLWRLGPAPDIDTSDLNVMQAMNMCWLSGADPRTHMLRPEGWSTSEAMIAAMMLLCPKIETAVADSFPRRSFATLGHILELVDQYCPSMHPQFQCWRVVPDVLTGFDGPDLLRTLIFPCKRLDLVPYPDLWQFSEPTFTTLAGVEDLRVNDNLFEFDDDAGNSMAFHSIPNENNPLSEMDARRYDDYFSFVERASLEFHIMPGKLRRLHWKLPAPLFFDMELEGDDDSADFTGDDIDGAIDHILADGTVVQVTEVSFNEGEVEFTLDMPSPNMQAQQAETNLQAETLDSDALMREVMEPPPPCTVEPSLYFVRWMQDLTHLETSTGAMYGLAGCLFEQSSLRIILPLSLEVLVLEERWYRGCAPENCLLGLYRWKLYWDLHMLVEKRMNSNLRRVVFIPDPHRNYWPGMSASVEWDRSRQMHYDAFSEMRTNMVEQGGREAADNGRRVWENIRACMTVIF